MIEGNSNGDFLAGPEGALDQFRLVRIQTYNWGTFSGISDFPISEAGFLFVGPSGSGKSTILDAHAALLTPPGGWISTLLLARQIAMEKIVMS